MHDLKRFFQDAGIFIRPLRVFQYVLKRPHAFTDNHREDARYLQKELVLHNTLYWLDQQIADG